ncbi:FMN-binding protein [Aliikangiella maris]|uniref:FMN-binding protein n=2 Tax=Aliikangiella maris TaxID=3162458 RepID=A0ABV3MKK4_9GAMM
MCTTCAASAKTYMTQSDFLNIAFPDTNPDNEPTAKVLWLDENIQEKLTAIFDHPYPKLRIRYWQKANESVWFLDEIGKEKPISFAIKVDQNKIAQIKVLAFRESRGGEIRMQAFTDQFSNVSLNNAGRLNQSIDGITGATMSVTAMKKVARAALMLAQLVNQ